MLSASCWAERASSEANTAGAPQREKPAFYKAEGRRCVGFTPDGAPAAPAPQGPRKLLNDFHMARDK